MNGWQVSQSYGADFIIGVALNAVKNTFCCMYLVRDPPTLFNFNVLEQSCLRLEYKLSFVRIIWSLTFLKSG